MKINYKHTWDHDKSSLTEGGGFLGIWKRALIGWTSANGGSPSAISIPTMPRDQTSHLKGGKNNFNRGNIRSTTGCFIYRDAKNTQYLKWIIPIF